MKFLRVLAILALFSTIGSSGCGGSSNSDPKASAASNPALDNANSAKTNTEELSMLINMPAEPDDVVWKQNAARNRLTAVLLYPSEKANKIVAEAAQHGSPQNVTVSSESWFPPELIAQSEMTGDDTLKGLAYSAEGFFQEPYTSGRVIRIDGTDYFVVELTGK